MPFNTLAFLVFLTVFTVVYYFIPSKHQSLLALIGSLCFYSYLSILNLIYLLLIIIITYYFVNKIRIINKSKLHLIFAIVLILLVLLLSKYSDVLVLALFNMSASIQILDYFIFPLGISFYSLQAISLLVDVDSRKYKNKLSIKEVGLFLSFFPQSISGPIHRADELIPQFKVARQLKISNIVIGLKIMLWGYFCKLIVADKISLITTSVFNTYLEKDGLTIYISCLLYSLQIYFDFWGYSLIAIGIGRILGFSINRNFNAPYLVASFKEFWRRWHITLSSWMRDYIYIPLGGRKQNNYILFIFSILITFLVSGFWHGATFNFIIWGFIHAILYLIEDAINRFNLIKLNINFPLLNRFVIPLLRYMVFYIIISFTWLIFRTESFSELLLLLKKIISVPNWSLSSAKIYYLTSTNIVFAYIILLAVIVSMSGFLKRKTESIPRTSFEKITDSLFVCSCVLIILLFGDIGAQEFLYFKF